MDEIILVVSELLTVVICLYRIHQRKIKFDLALVILISYYVLLYYCIINLNFSLGLSISIYAAIGIFSLYEFKERLLATFIECFLSVLILIIMQMIFYIPVSLMVGNPYKDILIGGIVNSLCLLTIILLGKKLKLEKIYLYIRQKSIVTYLCFLIVIIYLSIQIYGLRINYQWDRIHFTEVLIWLLLVFILWVQAQKNRMEKIEKEVQLREQAQYVKAFEEQLDHVRFKQHDIKNHLSAIYGMMEETKDDSQKLALQKNYYNYLLNDKDYKQLVKISNPMFTGFLKSKIKEMEIKEIDFQYDFAYIELESALSIYEWIEVTGVLLDNAIEAVENQSKDLKKIHMKLDQKENEIILKVSNISHYISNVESTAFFQKGYSTKGKGRGIGLAKVKELILKKNGEIVVRNVKENDKNWIEFIICIKD
ncbi:MAG: GHKL domain-containing protein [Lachnospiraceae bacterium]|nr:GHKL domain-containing protein [Lachnospiraceae bacterium]